MSTVETARPHGWDFIPMSTRAHYFAPDGRSLCGKFAAFRVVPYDAAADVRCSICVKREAGFLKRHAPSPSPQAEE